MQNNCSQSNYPVFVTSDAFQESCNGTVGNRGEKSMHIRAGPRKD